MEHFVILRVALAVFVRDRRHAYKHTFLVLKDSNAVDSEWADICRSKRLELFGIIVKELVDPYADIGNRLLFGFVLNGIVLLLCSLFLLLVLCGSSIAGAFLAIRSHALTSFLRNLSIIKSDSCAPVGWDITNHRK